ncbi:hypothetical protein LCGC14_2084970 [marine sediment metagenome]|uniref:Uncharacterized protein n=1 Tax=marine sediment metagenome TaxID=412755 RepID=A0A0F9HBI0_9ZZZZ
MFMHAFERDIDFQEMSPQSAYLDLERGNVIWVFEEDDDAEFYAGIESAENRDIRERIAASPENYLEVPGRDHSEHHKILQEFLSSGWTEDKELIHRVREAYSGSIGRWKEEVEDERVVRSYYDFREKKIKQLAEEHLREHLIEPNWR